MISAKSKFLLEYVTDSHFYVFLLLLIGLGFATTADLYNYAAALLWFFGTVTLIALIKSPNSRLPSKTIRLLLFGLIGLVLLAVTINNFYGFDKGDNPLLLVYAILFPVLRYFSESFYHLRSPFAITALGSSSFTELVIAFTALWPLVLIDKLLFENDSTLVLRLVCVVFSVIVIIVYTLRFYAKISAQSEQKYNRNIVIFGAIVTLVTIITGLWLNPQAMLDILFN